MYSAELNVCSTSSQSLQTVTHTNQKLLRRWDTWTWRGRYEIGTD